MANMKQTTLLVLIKQKIVRLAELNILQTILLFALLIVFMRILPFCYSDRDRPEIYSVSIELDPPKEVPEGSVSLMFTGSSLLHVNVLYINGKRVPVTYSSGIHYDSCRIAVSAPLIRKGEEVIWQIGKQYPISFGVIDKSNRLRMAL